MPDDIEYDWYDPTQTYYGEEWDSAWRLGTSAGKAMYGSWDEIAPRLEAMWADMSRTWADMSSRKSWIEARPAIYAAWRSQKNRKR